MSNPKKVVLAYSGGLDTSIILKWLIETYGCEVVCFAADLGQGDELTGLEDKAKKTGASKCYVEDLREEFVRDLIFPAYRANVTYEQQYFLGTSLARPLIAKRLVEIAEAEGADAIAHGATGKGNDQVRFELSVYALAPHLRIIAPWRIWDMKSRSELVAFAKKHGIPVPVTAEKPYSIDANMLHISFEGGILEDPWNSPPDNTYSLAVPVEEAPDKPEIIEIEYEQGDPVAVNGERLSPAELLAKLNKIGGAHGIGRVDLVENRYVGMKSRGVYETPGGSLIQTGHRAVESLAMDREVMHLRDSLMSRYSEMIYYGYWYAPEREVIQALIDKSQEKVTGTARLKLYKGMAHVEGRKSPYSLYNEELSTFEEDDVYNQADAEGFIRLNSLRLRLKNPVK